LERETHSPSCFDKLSMRVNVLESRDLILSLSKDEVTACNSEPLGLG